MANFAKIGFDVFKVTKLKLKFHLTICSLVELFLDFKRPCSSVVEQYPEKVCVVCAIQTKATTKMSKKEFYKIFKPELTPKKMMELGVFGGAYFGLNIKEYPKEWFKNVKLSKTFDVNLNRFKVVSGLSREHWIEKGWIYKEDPLGWFQWYCRFCNGRRIPHIDEIQIKRWKNFKRHVSAIKKNCETGDLSCRKKQRQAILQWAYDPFF